jgi:hypothetical protein
MVSGARMSDRLEIIFFFFLSRVVGLPLFFLVSINRTQWMADPRNFEIKLIYSTLFLITESLPFSFESSRSKPGCGSSR